MNYLLPLLFIVLIQCSTNTQTEIDEFEAVLIINDTVPLSDFDSDNVFHAEVVESTRSIPPEIEIDFSFYYSFGMGYYLYHTDVGHPPVKTGEPIEMWIENVDDTLYRVRKVHSSLLRPDS